MKLASSSLRSSSRQLRRTATLVTSRNVRRDLGGHRNLKTVILGIAQLCDATAELAARLEKKAGAK